MPEIVINHFIPLKVHPLPLPDLKSPVNYFFSYFCCIFFLFQWVLSCSKFFSIFTIFKGFGPGLQWVTTKPNIVTPFALSGDQGYPLKEYLMRPYSFDCSIKNKKATFNYRHSSAKRTEK